MDKSNVAARRRKEIRCALTDAQYHEIWHLIDRAKGVLELIQFKTNEDENTTPGMEHGLNLIEENLGDAIALMEKGWERTKEANHGQ